MGVPAPESQIQFLTNLQRLLGEGSFVATYKYALLMALADIAVEVGRDDDSPLSIDTTLIAEKFVQYYWRQSAPYIAGSGAGNDRVLRQNTNKDKQAGIITLLHEARAQYEGALPEVRRRDREWRRIVAEVRKFVEVMPLWRLQTVGREQHDFLYENLGKGHHIQLRPGVAFCLRKFYGLVADLVKGAWARYLRRYNPDILGTGHDLHEFLFGSERSNLSTAISVLREFQKGECFYCQRSLKDEFIHVDHFVPWSRYPVDLGHNLVLAHANCNERKSDRLAAGVHLERWVEHTTAHGADLQRELGHSGILSDVKVCARIADWAYGQTFHVQGLTWLRGNELQALPEDWNRSLTSLLN